MHFHPSNSTPDPAHVDESNYGTEPSARTTRRNWVKAGAAALTAAVLPAEPVWTQPTPRERAATESISIRARLSLNENAFGCSPRVVEAIRTGLGRLNRYTEREADDLKDQISAKEGVAPDQIVLGNVLAALGTQLSLAGGVGGEFLYSTPGFTDLVSAAERAGGSAIGIPLNGRLENDLPAFAARLNSRTRAVYLVNPHNPSGTMNRPEELRAFVRDVAQRALVVIDEAYLEYTDNFSALTFAGFVREGGNAVVFRTFDKIHGLAALQFGYALVPAALAQTLRQQGIGGSHGLNRLAVIAASAALRDVRFVNETRAKVAVERARWNAALARLGLRHGESHGSFVFFQADRPQKSLAAAFLAKGIDIGRDFPPLERWARVSIGLPAENSLAIATLGEILAQGAA